MRLRSLAALAVLFLFSNAAEAGIAEDLIAAIDKCAAIADDAARHKCYDALPAVAKSLTPSMTPGAAATAVPPPTTASAATAPADKRPEIAADASGGEPVPADHISAIVESFTFDFGVFVVTLDNGQVWRQVATNGDILHLSKSQKDHVTIWRNAFGVHVMKIEGYRTEYHVRRIK